MAKESANKHLQSTDFCLFLLNLFTTNKTSWGVRELAQHVGKSPSVVQRALNTLLLHELVQKNVAGRYQLGLKCIHLGYVAQQELKFNDQIDQCLTPWAKKIGLPLFFYVKQHHRASCLFVTEDAYIADTSTMLKLTATLGHGVTLHEAPVAQVILAHTDEAFLKHYFELHIDSHHQENFFDALMMYRQQGYAYSSEVLFKGTHSLSVPVFKANGGIAGALSVATTVQEGEASLMKHLKDLVRAASAIQPLLT